MYDFIVVGSGATGSMAAQTLVERGARVLMLDAGQRDEVYANRIPQAPFVDIRRERDDQYLYFLGENFEGIADADIGVGAQLTPPRRFIVREVERFLRFESDGFAPMESLAFGGLGAGWGLGCCVFSDAELQEAGLERAGMRQAYRIVAARIGISGAADDAQPYTFGDLTGIQPAVPLDPTCAHVAELYARKREQLRKLGFHLGRPALALLTQALGERQATQLRDMDFYDDAEQAAWRPWMTVSQLMRSSRFSYVGENFVTRFEECDDGVTVHSVDMRELKVRSHTARKLVLASGAFGSARIVLRSRDDTTSSLPFLCNPYVYMPCIVWNRIGKVMPDLRTGFCQLSLFHDPSGKNEDVAMGSLYTYRSLPIFRLLREMPFNLNDGLTIMRHLVGALLIAGIHHPDRRTPHKSITRIPADSVSADALRFSFSLSENEHRYIAQRERAYAAALRRLGAWPIKRVDPGHGSSIHYAGTLPFSNEDRPYTLDFNARLRGTKNVFVADGSGFTSLPAKSLTLSLMANAHRVAERLVQ